MTPMEISPLSNAVKQALREQIRRARSVDERNRLCCVLSYAEGRAVKDIATFLFLSEQTVRAYLRDYDSNQKTKHDPRGGSTSHLSEEQEVALGKHLNKHTYRNTQQIIEYVHATYGVLYSPAGMRHWLQRHGFCYKRPATMPGMLCPKKQADFVAHYEALRDHLPEDEAIYFMDSVHPAHQSQAVCGWILKGETKHLPTTSKQKRLHYTGALCLHQGHPVDVMLLESETVDQEAVIAFFKKLEARSPAQKIHLICDNAAYHRGKKVKAYLENSRIKLLFLPPYSPNLNPIERLWKVMREQKLYNRYYPTFSLFCEQIRDFFHKIPDLIHTLHARINDTFQRIYPNPIQYQL